MELKLFKSQWGMTEPLEKQFEMIAEAGYQGIEGAAPSKEQEKQFRSLLDSYKLDFIAGIHSDGDHIRSFRERAERAAQFGPLLINSHSGKDSMEWDDQVRFFESALDVEQKLGIPITHETHRGRPLYTPWTTARLLKRFPELRLNADFSHWVVVTESLLEDQQENVKLAMSRSIHVHGRVGFRHGPQVPDPAAPEYAAELQAHEAWWDEIVRLRAAEGAKHFTFTPEFGPPGYMHTLPYTRQPLANLWQVCLWMGRRFAARFQEMGL